ncbi:MAG: DoxX family protein [Pseudomonadota bacterium]|nr:DoxX family protein [Pseudomonadota bacterium]
MKTDPVNDAFDFLIGATGDQQALGPLRPFAVGLFLALLALSALIALQRWRRDESQRGPGPFIIWILRVSIGIMWFQGALWKLPLPVSGALQYWTEQMAANAAYPLVADLVRDLALPNMAVVDTLVLALELCLSISFMLGGFVRLFGSIGALYALGLWIGLYRHPAEWPWEYVFLAAVQIQFALYQAGASLGLDGWTERRLARVRRP